VIPQLLEVAVDERREEAGDGELIKSAFIRSSSRLIFNARFYFFFIIYYFIFYFIIILFLLTFVNSMQI